MDAAHRGAAASILQANIAIAPSNSERPLRDGAQPSTRAGGPAAGYGAGIGFYKSTDGGAHWSAHVDGPRALTGARPQDLRPLARIGGGDLPTVTVDPKNENVVYSASTVMWRTRGRRR